ncbi:MAG: hypothetical protein EBR82_51190 [Caulobacteraceae bacterium]|nr:hypothetical protein [Caulobacteraceae bacterium]
MGVRVAEGEIVIKTQGASKNTRGLTRDLDNLTKQSRATGQALSHHEKEVQRFGLGLVSATSNASALSASLRFFAKAGPVGLGLAVLARGGLAFAHELQDLRLESEKTSKSLADTFRAGILSKTSDEARASVKSINDQIFELNQQSQRIDLWRGTKKIIEQIAGKLGITVDLQTHNAENAIEEAKAKKVILEAEQKRLKTIETITNNTRIYISAREQINAIDEASVKLDFEKKTNMSSSLKISKQALIIANKEYDLQSDSLDKRKQSFEQLNKISQKNIEEANAALAIAKAKNDQVAIDQAILMRNKDTAMIESAREAVNKNIVSQKQAELDLIKAQRKETEALLSASTPGRQALTVAQKQKDRIDRKEAFKQEEEAVKARQKEENKTSRVYKNFADIRKIMAEEAVGLRVPNISRPGQPSASQSSMGGAGGKGRGASITPVPSANAESLPTSATGAQANTKDSGATASMSALLNAFNNLASLIKQAPLVSSA